MQEDIEKNVYNFQFEKSTNQPEESSKFRTIVKKWIMNHLWIFPLLSFYSIISLLILPYCLAITYRTIDPIFPYVSDAGSMPPASSVFLIYLDLIGFLSIINTLIRYNQVGSYIQCIKNGNFMAKVNNFNHNVKKRFINKLTRLNRRSTLIMIFGSICIFLVGCFSTISFFNVHTVFAFLMFLSTTIYIVMQTYLAYLLDREFKIESSPITMTIIAIMSISFHITIIILEIVVRIQIGRKIENNKFRLHWIKHDMGSYVVHCLCTLSEWLLLISYAFFHICFINRFRKIKY